MSSLYVRDMVRDWCRDPEMSLPFLDTVNFEDKPPAPMWSTVSFVSAQTATTSYCGGIEERGIFDFIALGTGGVGDHDLIEAAEHDVALLLQHVDPAYRLTLLRTSPAQDFLQAGGVPWYTVSFIVEYVYQQPPPGVAADPKGANHATA
jgi:hypothetical protein